jgi:hypothetical protein
MTIKFSASALAIAVALVLSACGTRRPAVAEPEPPEPTANAQNTVILSAIRYGKTDKGLQLAKADDACDVPASLGQAIQDQLQAPYEFAVPSPSANVAGAPMLRIDVTDLLANAGGLYGGPKIVQLHGVLERPGTPPVQFSAQRQMFIYFGLPRSTCSMVGQVTYALGEDIAKWLVHPVDGSKLGNW